MIRFDRLIPFQNFIYTWEPFLVRSSLGLCSGNLAAAGEAPLFRIGPPQPPHKKREKQNDSAHCPNKNSPHSAQSKTNKINGPHSQFAQVKRGEGKRPKFSNSA
jgi:hypothetical protein